LAPTEIERRSWNYPSIDLNSAQDRFLFLFFFLFSSAEKSPQWRVEKSKEKDQESKKKDATYRNQYFFTETERHAQYIPQCLHLQPPDKRNTISEVYILIALLST
ncbi:MAG: hypothetical protein Q8R12_01835, partial [bacterium]|nr:hypothetical protein [bacterium]